MPIIFFRLSFRHGPHPIIPSGVRPPFWRHSSPPICMPPGLLASMFTIILAHPPTAAAISTCRRYRSPFTQCLNFSTTSSCHRSLQYRHARRTKQTPCRVPGRTAVNATAFLPPPPTPPTRIPASFQNVRLGRPAYPRLPPLYNSHHNRYFHAMEAGRMPGAVREVSFFHGGMDMQEILGHHAT